MFVFHVSYIGVVVAETAPFQADARKLFTEDDLFALIDHLARNPECGDLVPGTGGVRKLRWAIGGKGKRGGARVIYFYADETMPLYLIAAFAKGEKVDLSGAERVETKSLVKEIVRLHRSRRKRAS
jgi:hypothetical protein